MSLPALFSLWCRYAGYLGLKYFLAARHDVSTALLPQAVPILSKGLLVGPCCSLHRVCSFHTGSCAAARSVTWCATHVA